MDGADFPTISTSTDSSTTYEDHRCPAQDNFLGTEAPRGLLKEVARDFIESILSFLNVAAVSHAGTVTVQAVRRHEDFEDGAIGEAAAEHGADVICTRNAEDFGAARPQVLGPGSLRAS